MGKEFSLQLDVYWDAISGQQSSHLPTPFGFIRTVGIFFLTCVRFVPAGDSIARRARLLSGEADRLGLV